MSTRSRRQRAAADLVAAADVIAQYGWLNQGGGSCAKGFCLSDALARVTGRDGRDHHRRDRHEAAIGLLAGRIRKVIASKDPDRPASGYIWPLKTVIRYNDHEVRDAAEAEQLLRDAAASVTTPTHQEGTS